MVFSTPVFLFYFLVLTLLVYYLVPRKLRNVVILISSLIFYYWGEQTYVVIMFLSTAIDFTHGMLVEHFKGKGQITYAKMAVASSMFFNLLLLLFFKYWDFLASSLQAIGLTFMPVLGIHLPIGISFYTFQTMSYTIDVYRKDAPVQRNMVEFGTFVTMFPQLIAGPIVQYKTVAADLVHRVHTSENFALGARRFCVGLAKKVLLANSIGALWEECLAAQGAGTLTVLGGWLGLAAYGFQIYFDFSGYSDMAIGLGRMFGFHFLENFNYPYLSRSVTEFWRRWHISLSTWFRDYVYIPLGGNRCSAARHIRNILVVWALTGFWHGAAWTFVAWGLYYALLLLGEKYLWGRALERLPALLRHLYALVLILLGWVLFRSESLTYAGRFISAMFGGAAGGWTDGRSLYYLLQFRWELLLAIPASLPLRDWALRRLEARDTALSGLVLTWGPKAAALGLFALSFLRLVSSSYNPFIYFRF